MPSRCTCCLSAPLPAAYLATVHSCSPARRCMCTRSVRRGWAWLAWDMPNRSDTGATPAAPTAAPTAAQASEAASVIDWLSHYKPKFIQGMLAGLPAAPAPPPPALDTQRHYTRILLATQPPTPTHTQHGKTCNPATPPLYPSLYSPRACCCGSPTPSRLPLRLFLLWGLWWWWCLRPDDL